MARWRQQARPVSSPLAGLAHWQPHVQRVSPSEVGAAHTACSQQHPPPSLADCAFVVKHPDCDDGVAGQLVIHGRLHVGELGIQGVLGPRNVVGSIDCRDLHQRVWQVIGLESHCHTCRLHRCDASHFDKLSKRSSHRHQDELLYKGKRVAAQLFCAHT